MYLLQLGPVTYSGHRDGRPFTLTDVLRETHGCRDAHLLRADGTLVVRDCGRAYSPLVHAPSGRTVHRRRVRRPAGDRGALTITVRGYGVLLALLLVLGAFLLPADGDLPNLLPANPPATAADLTPKD